jgi:hypothetical protein
MKRFSGATIPERCCAETRLGDRQWRSQGRGESQSELPRAGNSGMMEAEIGQRETDSQLPGLHSLPPEFFEKVTIAP